MRRFRSATLGALSFALPAILSAQMFVTRNAELRTFDDSTPTGTFSGQTHAFTEWQHGYGSVAGEQAWDVKAGLTVDLVRSRSIGVLRLSMNAELLANPYNNTRFNPRGAYFEPVLSLDRNVGGLVWQVSLFHRCRHDIDNLDPADSREGINGMRYKRVIILSGPQIGVGSSVISLGHDATASVSGHVELYPVRVEERRPDDAQGLYWDRAVGATSIGARLAKHISKSVEPYVRGWEAMVLFHSAANMQSRRSNFNGRLEVGTRFAGISGNADAFVAFEHTFDDLTPPHGNAGHVFFAGIRLAARGFE